MQQQTARERAEQALQHMPIMPSAKEVVTVLVAAEIKSAISDTLEEAAELAESQRPLMLKHMSIMDRLSYCLARSEIAAAIRAKATGKEAGT